MSEKPKAERCRNADCNHAKRVHARGICDHIRQSCEDIGCEQTRCNVAFCRCTSYVEPWHAGRSDWERERQASGGSHE